MADVLEITGCSGFTGALDEILTDMERKTDLGNPENDTPVLIMIYSDGSVDREGKRVSTVRAYPGLTPVEVAENIIEENQ